MIDEIPKRAKVFDGLTEKGNTSELPHCVYYICTCNVVSSRFADACRVIGLSENESMMPKLGLFGMACVRRQRTQGSLSRLAT